MNNEEKDQIKKRLNDIKEVNPRYLEILTEPKFTLIPTIDSAAREYLNSQNIRSVADLAVQDPDQLSIGFLKTKHHIEIVKEWLTLPGNLNLLREIWDQDQVNDDFDIESLEFPIECSECHKKIKESDDFLLRIDNQIYCPKCASFYAECQSCSKIFEPDYTDVTYFGETPEFCPNCEKIERNFANYVNKLSIDKKVDFIISSWVDLAIDSILHRNMHWYLMESN